MKPLEFDVVVIGAGIGGVCTAARLSNAGYRVLLAERTSLIGGRFSAIKTKGFVKTTGAIIVPANSVIEDTFTECGLDFPGRDIDALAWRVNGEDNISTIADGLGHSIMTVADDKEGAMRVLQALERALTWELPTPGMSFRDWIGQYTADPKVMEPFFPVITAFLCSNYDELDVTDLLALVKGQMQRPWRITVAPKGNAEFLKPLVNVVKANEGEVWKNCQVEQVLVEDHQTKGVRLTNKRGESLEVSSQAVVSNMGPHPTARITGHEHFDPAYLKELARCQYAPLYTVVLLESDAPLIDHPYLIFPVGTKKISAMFCPTNSCPELAPEGKHLTEVWASIPDPVTADTQIDVQLEIDSTIAEIGQFIPGALEKSNILSIENFDRDWPVFRAMSHYLPQKTPVQNLYNVGDGIRVPGFVGLALGAETARLAAEDIRQRIPATAWQETAS